LIILSALPDVEITFSPRFLRIFRIFRLARTGRVLNLFPQLALMVQGLFGTLQVVLSGLMLLGVALIVIAILAVQVVHPINLRVASKGIYEGCERCPRAFESTGAAALTFTQQIITGDSWGLLSIPIIEEDPKAAIFFLVVYTVLALMVLNVILSMVVESSIKAAQEDMERVLKEKEKAFKDHSEHFKHICESMDADQSGCLTKHELMSGFDDNPEFQNLAALMELRREDLDAVFGILDQDGSGDVAYDEFASELYKMKTHDSHTLLVFIKHYVSEIKALMSTVVKQEFVYLHEVLGVRAHPDNQAGPRTRGKSDAQLCIDEARGQQTIFEAVRDVQVGLRSEIMRTMEEMLQKVDAQGAVLSELQGQRQHVHRSEGQFSARAPPPHLPRPAHEPDGHLQTLTLPPVGDASPVKDERHAIGPLCHYIGRGDREAVRREATAKRRWAGAFDAAAPGRPGGGGPPISAV